jgi:hypothetical protein
MLSKMYMLKYSSYIISVDVHCIIILPFSSSKQEKHAKYLLGNLKWC